MFGINNKDFLRSCVPYSKKSVQARENIDGVGI